MVKLATGGTNPDGGGQFISEACDCHFTVDAVTIEGDGIKLKLQAVGSTVESQVGKTTDQKLFFPNESSQYPASNVNRLLGFACAVGLYNRLQWKADIAAGNDDVDIPFENAEGRQFCGKIEMEAGKDDPNKKFARLKRSWAVGDKEAAHVPKDQELLAMLGPKLPTSDGEFVDPPKPNGSGGSKASGQKPPTQKQSSKDATPKDEDF